MKFLLILVLLVILYFRFVKGKKKVSQKEKRELVTELVFDENCGTYINKNSAIRIKIGDREYYFCSKECAEEFLKKSQSSH